MRQTTFFKLISMTALVAASMNAHAIPDLQLTILNGFYDHNTQTTIAPSGTNIFTLYALLSEKYSTDPNGGFGGYWISAALYPIQPNNHASLGSFKFDNQTINVTSDMVWGTPTYAKNNGPGDLPDHGIYPTWYKEFQFNFNPANVITEFDVQASTPNTPLVANSSLNCGQNGVKCMYFAAFQVDVSNLNSGYAIHFDLYDKTKAGDFAPFSHDAQSATSRNGGGPGGEIPEPAGVALLGIGALALAWSRRRKGD